MFKLMGRIQNWVLTIAGVATAGLFGITATDIQGCIHSSEIRKHEVSADERKHVLRNLRIGSILNDTTVPSDQMEEVVGDYANQLRQAEAEGIAVSDHELGMFIMQRYGGKDDYNKFSQFIEQRYNLSKSDVEGYYRDILLFNKLNQLSRLPLYITRSEVLDEYHRRNDEWTFDRILADSSVMIPTVAPSEEDLKSWFEDNAFDDRFRVPESVTIEYLMLKPESITVADPEDFELRDYYNENREKYSSSEYEGETKPYFEVLDSVKADYLEETQKATAKRLLSVLDIELVAQDNPDFKGSLKAKTETNPEYAKVVYGTSENFTKGSFMLDPLGMVYNPNLSNRVFGSNPRNYGGVLEAGNGLYIYRVIARQEEGMMDFAAAREDVEKAVELEKKSEMALSLLENHREKIVASGNWSALELPVGLSYERKDAKGLFAQEGQILADLGEGEISPISELGSDHVILKVIKRMPADPALIEQQEESLKQSIWGKKAQAIQKLSSVED